MKAWPDFVPWFWQLRGYPHTAGGSHKSLLLTGTFISSILVQEILTVDSGFECLGFRSCLCPHKDPGLPHLLLFTSNQRVDLTIYSSLWISCLGTIWKAKQKVIKQVLKTSVIKDSLDISGGLWGLCPLPLFYQSTWLCFVFVFCLLGLCQQCLPALLSGSLITSMQKILHHKYSFPRALKLLFCLIFSSIGKRFFLLAQ